MSVKREHDSTIQRIFVKWNLGSLPDAPFSFELTSNLTNKIKTRLFDLDKDLQERKVIFNYSVRTHRFSS